MDAKSLERETLAIVDRYAKASGETLIVPEKYGSGNGETSSYWVFRQEGEKFQNLGFVYLARQDKIHDGLEEMEAKYALKDFESQLIYALGLHKKPETKSYPS
jgi:hypothetical protein